MLKQEKALSLMRERISSEKNIARLMALEVETRVHSGFSIPCKRIKESPGVIILPMCVKVKSHNFP
jgi:hypothetical protein